MKRKILITTVGLSSVGQGGGISSYSHDLAENLATAGHNVTVFLIKEFPNSEPLNVRYSYKFYRVGESRIKEETQVKRILMDIEALKPHVIINNETSYVSGLWPALDENIIKISIMHAFSKTFTLSNAGIGGKMASVNHEYLDYIICQNSEMVKSAAYKYKIPLEKLIFIPQCASYLSLEVKPENNIFTITFAGGQNKRKGAVEMFELSKYLHRSTLDFKVNWCLNAEKYKNYFKADNRFIFLGSQLREDFYTTLKSSDCIIIPTHLDTGPMLLVEAMGQGVIPMANNLRESAIPDIIEHYKNGVLVENNNPKRYFKELKKLINNSEFRNKLRINTNTYFLNNLTKSKQLKKFENLFENKKSIKKKAIFNNRNIIYFHLRKTSHLSRFSFKRIKIKVINALELPMYKKK